MRKPFCQAAVAFYILGNLLFPGGASAEPPPNPRGALAAIRAVPYEFQDGILEVSGKSGAPEPEKWVLIVRDADSEGTIVRLEVADGRVIRQSPSGNLGEMFREGGYLDPDTIKKDAPEIFQIASEYAKNQHSADVAAADYLLRRPGEELPATWRLVCRDSAGKELGVLEFSATDASLLTESGFSSKK